MLTLATRFPKPTVLYSMHTGKGEQMHEEPLIDFLTNIVSKRPLIHEEKLLASLPIEELIANFPKTSASHTKVSCYATLHMRLYSLSLRFSSLQVGLSCI